MLVYFYTAAMEPNKIQCLIFDPNKLKQARMAKFPDLSANRVAVELLGITRQALWEYEQGISKPSPTTLARICALYDIELLALTDYQAAA